MALTEIYVDAAAAGGGDGSIGTPYNDLEAAIVAETFDTTNGTRINIKSGTDCVLTANLADAFNDTSVSIAWAPGRTTNCILQGYTATAGDGGKGGIQAATNTTLFKDANIDWVQCVDLHLHGSGNTRLFDVDNNWFWYKCEFSDATGAILGDAAPLVDSCYFHDFTGGNALYASSTDGMVFNSYVDARGSTAVALNMAGASNIADNNIVIVSGACKGISFASTCVIKNNSIYSEGGTGVGISELTIGTSHQVSNNIVAGFSGAGGVGIQADRADHEVRMIRGNAVYDCTTAYDLLAFHDEQITISGGDNETLIASPFADAANGDFSIIDIGDVRGGALPSVIGGGFV